jgi:hypothetical protein
LVGRRLEAPRGGRTPIGVSDVVGAVAHGVAEVDQNLVQRRRRLVPTGLFDPIRLGQTAVNGAIWVRRSSSAALNRADVAWIC